jgi:hypothetical protein
VSQDTSLGTIDRFQLQRAVQTDAWGTVYEAWDPDAAERLAVRILPPRRESHGAEMKAGMRARGVAAVELVHPNIARLHEIGWHGQSPFVATAWVQGQTLTRYRSQLGRLPAHQALAMAVQLLSALQQAHGRGVVHSRIHPDHLLVTCSGRLVVTGFGWMGEFMRGSAPSPGACAYLAPEQVLGCEPTALADLYSASVVAYELLTGTLPFPDADAAATSASLRRNPRPVRAARPALPASLDGLFERALAPDPHARIACAADLSLALQAAIGPPLWTRPALARASSNGSATTRDSRAMAPASAPAAATGAAVAPAAVAFGTVPSPGSGVHVAAPVANAPHGAASIAQACHRVGLVLATGCAAATVLAVSLLGGPSQRASPAPATIPPRPAAVVAQEPPAVVVGAQPSSATAWVPADPPGSSEASKVTAPPVAVEARPDRNVPAPAMSASRNPEVAPSRDQVARGEHARPTQALARRASVRVPQPEQQDRRHDLRLQRTQHAAAPDPSCRQGLAFARGVCTAFRCAAAEFRSHPICVRMHAEGRARERLAQARGGS